MAKKFIAKKFRQMTNENKVRRFTDMLVEFETLRKSVDPLKADIIEAYGILRECGINVEGFTLSGGIRTTMDGKKAVSLIPSLCEAYRDHVTSDLADFVNGVALSTFNDAIAETGTCVPTAMEERVTNKKEIAESFKLSKELKVDVDAKVKENMS